jgi:RNA polymerase sigma-32 factor
MSGLAGLSRHRPPRLSPEEERELALRWRDQRDEAARDRIVSAHLDLVRGVISRIRGADLSREDLFQDGVIGLMKAVDRFDPGEGTRFSTYASYWVRAEVQSALGETGGPVRIPRSHEANRVATWFHRVRSRVESDVALGLCPPPEDGVEREAARRMGVDPEEISALLSLVQARGIPVMTQSASDEDREEGVLLISDLTPERLLADRQRQAIFADALRAACAELSDRDREVIERRYLTEEPETFQAIADRFGLTRERIRQIEVRALRSIHRKLLERRGFRRLISDS